MVEGSFQSWLGTLLGPIATAVPSIITLCLVLRQKRTIDLLEVNTNSIKDALIVSTAKASGLEGEKRGRSEQRAETEQARGA